MSRLAGGIRIDQMRKRKAFDTEKLVLQGAPLTQMMRLYRHAFTHRNLYTQALLHRKPLITHKTLAPKRPYTDKL